MSAVVGLRFTQSISRALELPLNAAAFYSDSIDVLRWIRGRGRDFHPFVANRIGEIQMYTDPAQWQHVPTEQNPADLCSRGTGPVKLPKSPLWWDGPQWMNKGKSEWPRMQLEDSPTIIARDQKRKETEDRAYYIHVVADKRTTEFD